jgi:hypothetical protein
VSRYIFFLGVSAFIGCHSSHKVSARVESTGFCMPDIAVQTVTNGSADLQMEQKTTPWQREFPAELTELRIDAANVDGSGCTQVQCQITVDGAVAVVRGDSERARCEWKP